VRESEGASDEQQYELIPSTPRWAAEAAEETLDEGYRWRRWPSEPLKLTD